MEYNVRNACVAACNAFAEKKTPDLKALLAEHTDIPADRLDFATGEIGQVLFGMKAMVAFFDDLVSDATWIDDGGQIALRVVIRALKEPTSSADLLLEAATEITRLRSLLEERTEALREMVRLADMGLEESLREPEENGNFAAYNRAVAALKEA